MWRKPAICIAVRAERHCKIRYTILVYRELMQVYECRRKRETAIETNIAHGARELNEAASGSGSHGCRGGRSVVLWAKRTNQLDSQDAMTNSKPNSGSVFKKRVAAVAVGNRHSGGLFRDLVSVVVLHRRYHV
jgi:hypothetical protein